MKNETDAPIVMGIDVATGNDRTVFRCRSQEDIKTIKRLLKKSGTNMDNVSFYIIPPITTKEAE